MMGVVTDSPAGADERRPTVSVVITTVDRPSLVDAVKSALSQELVPVEVIVVFDGGDTEVAAPVLPDPRVRVLRTGGRRGPSVARQLGAEAAIGDLVAWLDDDDVWRSDKLQRQVQEYLRLSQEGQHVVVSCQADLRLPDGRSRGVAPRRDYHDDTDVADFLFIRHSLGEGSFGLASSTLLCDAALVNDVAWDSKLRLHEDWDWVLRAIRAGALLSVIPAPLVVYRIQPPGAAASRPPGGWDESAAWARSVPMSPAALGDFLLCVSAVNAAAYGNRSAALSLALSAVREGRPTWLAWLAFVIQLTIPLEVVGAVAAAVRRVAGWVRPPAVQPSI
jgi:hypothetical protein